MRNGNSIRRTLKSSGVLLCVLATLFLSCREELPLGGSQTTEVPPFRFLSGDSFTFDNWLVDYTGRIPSSYFRNSWTVVDTGATVFGRTPVTMVIDSTFETSGNLARRDTLYFQFTPSGDIYQYGFLKNLIAQRETLTIAPQWDRIAAFSLPREESWVIARFDSSVGARTPETVYGRILEAQEYVGVKLNDVLQAVLAYRIEILGPRLNYTLWLASSPTAIAKAFDDSSILRYATLRELASMRRR
ncbi:MAG: hypothetical protein HY961_13555 [Ignavibacteriae bacterium]|nr:hypothetical protein [Ignavibacteriota bacterium]